MINDGPSFRSIDHTELNSSGCEKWTSARVVAVLIFFLLTPCPYGWSCNGTSSTIDSMMNRISVILSVIISSARDEGNSTKHFLWLIESISKPLEVHPDEWHRHVPLSSTAIPQNRSLTLKLFESNVSLIADLLLRAHGTLCKWRADSPLRIYLDTIQQLPFVVRVNKF